MDWEFFHCTHGSSSQTAKSHEIRQKRGAGLVLVIAFSITSITNQGYRRSIASNTHHCHADHLGTPARACARSRPRMRRCLYARYHPRCLGDGDRSRKAGRATPPAALCPNRSFLPVGSKGTFPFRELVATTGGWENARRVSWQRAPK